MKYGFVRTATAVPVITPGDCHSNAAEIISAATELAKKNVELILFPELCLTSSNCRDIFKQRLFIEKCEEAISRILKSTESIEPIIIFGSPVLFGYAIYNCAIVAHRGEIIGIVPQKGNNTKEHRFADGNTLPYDTTVKFSGKNIPFIKNAIFQTERYSFGIEIGSESSAPFSPGASLAVNGAEIILNPMSAEAMADSCKQTRNRIKEQSRRYKCAYMTANSGWGESTSHASYDGYNAIAECGHIIAEGERFMNSTAVTITEIDIEKIENSRRCDSNFKSDNGATYIYIEQEANNSTELTRSINPNPFIPAEEEQDERFEEIFMIQATALARRIEHTRSATCIIGISGGLDSTLALLVTEKACKLAGKKPSDIIAVTMPGFGTSGRTYNNALKLMKSLGVTIKEISIKEACIQHFKDIEHNIDIHDVTYENAQARERTQILMDIANQKNGIVIGTGDLSELALGWATYNGDHMSMYGVNASVPKTLMQHIVRRVANNCNDIEVRETLLDIIATPISPELIPTENENIKQKTEDLVGPYELHDFFLYNFIHNGFAPEKIFYLAKQAFKGVYDNETIKKWLSTFMRRFFVQQFKRSCMPDGPVTGNCNLNSRSGWEMPADMSGAIWNEDCKNII